MSIRPTQSSIFNLVHRGLQQNFAKLALAQIQVSTGKRIHRPSDDAVGTAQSLYTRRQLGEIGRYMGAVGDGRPLLEASTSALQDVSSALTEVRELVLQGMSGTMSSSDRATIGGELEELASQLLTLANSRHGDTYLFSGTATGTQPYDFVRDGDSRRSEYYGDDGQQQVAIGNSTRIAVNLPGSDIFDRFEYSGVDFADLTGVRLGTSANQGTGYETLSFRHDATAGAPGSGVVLAGGGAQDTILGDRSLVIDATARTVQLDGGPVLSLPSPTDPDWTDFVVKNEYGGEVHLDFSGYNATDSTTTLTGSGSVSLGGSAYTPLTLGETDLELVSADSGAVLHIDTTRVHRAGEELVTFSGTVSLFDAIQGIADDMQNSGGLGEAEFLARVSSRLGEFERGFDNVLQGLGTLGARSSRMNSTESRLQALDVNVQGVLSQIEDVDLADVVLDLTRSEQTLQLAQMTGSRLIQHSLLDYLR